MNHHFELEIIRSIQQFRIPWMEYLDFFDRQEFFFILIPMVWLCCGWKNGLKLFYILFLSSLTNHALKSYFLSPRPFHLDPTLGIIQVKGLGFPSGAAQTVILISGILISFWKNAWKWPVVIAYISLVSFSRVYLGIHFPSDILGGWFVGFGLLAVYLYVFPLLEKQLQTLRPVSLFCLSQVGPLLLLSLGASIPLCCVAMGMSLGLFVCQFYQLELMLPQSKLEYVLRALIGVLGTFACYFLTMPFSTAGFFLVGLWVSLGSLSFKKLLQKTS